MDPEVAVPQAWSAPMGSKYLTWSGSVPDYNLPTLHSLTKG
ncbi:unnamed protein product, partial [marine sediment metagenome]